jgi:hypothetical protein
MTSTFRGTISTRQFEEEYGWRETGELVAEVSSRPVVPRWPEPLVTLTLKSSKNEDIVKFRVNAEDFDRLASLAERVANDV